MAGAPKQARGFGNALIADMALLMKGTPRDQAVAFGETLDEEREVAGAFHQANAGPPEVHVPDGELRLVGGRQIMRTKADFKCVALAVCTVHGWTHQT